MPGPMLAIVPLLIKTAIGAKLIAFTASWATSPTTAPMRKSFIRHVDNVRDSLQIADIPLENSDDAKLLADIEVLRESAGRGWTEPNETLALWEILKFLSWAHSKATVSGVGKFGGSHLTAAYKMAEKARIRLVEFVLPETKK